MKKPAKGITARVYGGRFDGLEIPLCKEGDDGSIPVFLMVSLEVKQPDNSRRSAPLAGWWTSTPQWLTESECFYEARGVDMLPIPLPGGTSAMVRVRKRGSVVRYEPITAKGSKE